MLLIQLDRTMIDAPRLSSLVSLTDDNATAFVDLIGASFSELHARARQTGQPAIVAVCPTAGLLLVLSRCVCLSRTSKSTAVQSAGQ